MITAGIASETDAVYAREALMATAARQRSGAVERTALIGVAGLLLAAPFEALQPLLRLPGQTVSSVEAVFLCVCMAVGLSVMLSRTRPVVAWADILRPRGWTTRRGSSWPRRPRR